MLVKSYETVVVFTPVLKEDEVQGAIGKYRELLKSHGAEIVQEDFWGLRSLAYPIKKKTTGIYLVMEFRSTGEAVERLEIQYKRDENVLRFLTVNLDKFAQEYNDKKRKGLAGRNRKKTTTADESPVAES